MGLNKNQQQILDNLDATINVAAGAGTGKTFTLTKRTIACIEAIIKKNMEGGEGGLSSSGTNRQPADPSGDKQPADPSGDVNFAQSANYTSPVTDSEKSSSREININPIERVLEITFTTKAASELKSRIRSELFDVAAKTGSPDILNCALDVDNAWISTIHGMCSRILRENALAFGIDPSFEVLEGAAADAIFAAAVDAKVADFKENGGPFADELLQGFDLRGGSGFGNSGIIDMVRTLNSKLIYMPSGSDALRIPEFILDPRRILRVMLEAAADIPSDFAPDGLGKTDAKKSDEYARQLAEAQKDALSWLQDNPHIGSFADPNLDAGEYLTVLGTFPATTAAFGKKSTAWDAFQNYRLTYRDCAAGAVSEVGLRYLTALLTFTEIVIDECTRLKNQVNTRLDNNDLLKRTAAELADPKCASIAARYRSQFEYIMLDEFQDTDKLQMSIVRTLARDKNALQGRVEFANLCTVGDMQQSIYRFRGGDVELSALRAREVADLPCAHGRLDTNYRSHPAVLDATEIIFSQSDAFGTNFLKLSAGRTDQNQTLEKIFAPQYQSEGGEGEDDRSHTTTDGDELFSRSENSPSPSGPQLQTSGTDYFVSSALRQKSSSPGNPSAGDARIVFDFVHHACSTRSAAGVSKDDARRVSARRIAMRFRYILDASTKSGDADAIKSAGSMAILLRNMSHADVYADALRDVGIDSIIAGGSVFADTDEAALTSSLLNVCANPQNESALINVLTSKMFNLTDNALLAICFPELNPPARRVALSQAFFAPHLPQNVLDDLTADELDNLQLARTTLMRMREIAAQNKPSAALRFAYAASGMLSRLNGTPFAKPTAADVSSAANISKSIHLTESIEAALTGPAAVAQAFGDYLQSSAESPGTLAQDCANAVQIMTIHSSKGLEFDHIAIAELNEPHTRPRTLNVENMGEATYASFNVPKIYATDAAAKNITVAKGFTFDDDENSLADAPDPENLAARVQNARTAADLASALDAYTRAQEAAEEKRIYYVALTRARESALVEFLIKKKPGAYKGVPACTYSAIVNVLNAGADIEQAEFTRRDKDITTKRIYLTQETLKDHLPEKNTGEGEGEGSEIPSYFDVPVFQAIEHVQTRKTNLVRQDLYSYTSLSGSAPLKDTYDVVFTDDDEEVSQTYAVRAADPDKATDFGSAFHALAQLATITGKPPTAAQVEAQARLNGLGDSANRRLQAALDVWFASDIAKQFFARGQITAETPFCVKIDDFYLEGEIDALSQEGDTSWIVDYKTGGSAGDTPAHLHKKHLFQAQCYAYALMRAGAVRVRATFVRVEQACSDGGPSAVEFSFTKDNLAQIEEKIIRAREQLVVN